MSACSADSVNSSPEFDYYSEDEDAFQDETSNKMTPERVSLTGEHQYRMSHSKDVLKSMFRVVRDMATFWNLNETTVRLLLSAYKWDKELITEKYYEMDASLQKMLELNKLDTHPYMLRGKQFSRINSMATPSTANLFNPNLHPLDPANDPLKLNLADQAQTLCEICFTECPLDEMRGMDCRHYFCLDCWEQYLRSRIIDHNQSTCIYCPATDCRLVLDDFSCMNMIHKDEQLRSRFERSIAFSYMNSNPLMCWCVGSNCPMVAEVAVKPYIPLQIHCTECDSKFCFNCGENWHAPVSCKLLKAWITYSASESCNMKWISANTKACPKCGKNIEKNGGCNHMSCTQCSFQFCWICLLDWNNHADSYSCNRFDENEVDRMSVRGEIDRYSHYHSRYEVHVKSLSLQAKSLRDFAIKLRQIQEHSNVWLDENLVQSATVTLEKCRITLLNSYIFSYHMEKNNQLLIFEDNQADLEKSVENLCWLCESNVQVKDVADYKMQLENKTKYCDARNTVLLAHVHEGFTNDEWTTRKNCLTLNN